MWGGVRKRRKRGGWEITTETRGVLKCLHYDGNDGSSGRGMETTETRGVGSYDGNMGYG